MFFLYISWLLLYIDRWADGGLYLCITLVFLNAFLKSEGVMQLGNLEIKLKFTSYCFVGFLYVKQ